MYCTYCSTKMDAVGLGNGNGWECPACKHQEPEILSFKLAGDLGFSCSCNRCKSEVAIRQVTSSERLTTKQRHTQTSRMKIEEIQELEIEEKRLHRALTKNEMKQKFGMRWLD